MKRILFMLAFLLMGSVFCAAQPYTIVAAESFWDTDPGLGNGTPFTVVPDDSVNLSGEISTTGLTPGMHTLHIRMQRSDGVWGKTVERKVRAGIGTEYQAAEVFFDTDPGEGEATPVAITPDGRVNEAAFAVPDVPRGFHRFNLRCFSGGTWSAPTARVVRVGSAWLDGAEVFFDTDPGEGNGIPVSTGFGPDVVALDSSVAVQAAGTGFHTVYLRFRGGGVWSFPKPQTMRIGPWVDGSDRISEGEFFFDTDPGEGNGCPLMAEDGTFDELEEAMRRYVVGSNLSLGPHVVYARIRDGGGRWNNVVRDTVQIIEARVVADVVLDTLGHRIRVAWNTYPEATLYRVHYDSLLTGPFTQFVTVAAPDTLVLLPTDPLRRYYRVTAVQTDAEPCDAAALREERAGHYSELDRN